MLDLRLSVLGSYIKKKQQTTNQTKNPQNKTEV